MFLPLILQIQPSYETNVICWKAQQFRSWHVGYMRTKEFPFGSCQQFTLKKNTQKKKFRCPNHCLPCSVYFIGYFLKLQMKTKLELIHVSEDSKQKGHFLGRRLYQYLVDKRRRNPGNEKKERHDKISQMNAIPRRMSYEWKNRPGIVN